MEPIAPTEDITDVSSDDSGIFECSSGSQLDILETPSKGIYCHVTVIQKIVAKGKGFGKFADYFRCNYCKNIYKGPSTSTMLKHLRLAHKDRCPELLNTTAKITPKINNLFSKKTSVDFTEENFQALLIKFIIKTDQPLSIIDNVYFKELIGYLKINLELVSRRTLVRRMEDCYIDVKSIMKNKLKKLKSKYSITCDVWTSKKSTLL